MMELDLGVPRARSARTYALVGLAITAVVGLLVWDILGLFLGIPLASFGVARGIASLAATRDYPRDRRAAITAVVAGVLAVLLVIPIVTSAFDAGGGGVPCEQNAACRDYQSDNR